MATHLHSQPFVSQDSDLPSSDRTVQWVFDESSPGIGMAFAPTLSACRRRHVPPFEYGLLMRMQLMPMLVLDVPLPKL